MNIARKEVEPFLVDAQEAGRLLGISRTQFLELVKSGRVGPESINLGCHAKRQFRRWKVAELRQWVNCGCPSHREWTERRKIS